MYSAKAHDQKTFLAGSIARALAVFCVDEVIIFDDGVYQDTGKPSHDGYTGYSDPCHFLSHLLSYLETPPYLRKHLFPMHPNLRTAGTLPSLDMPHHMRANEWNQYREGVTVGNGPQNTGTEEDHDGASEKKNKGKKKNKKGLEGRKEEFTLVNTGLPESARLEGVSIPENNRVTLKFRSEDPADGADPVAPTAPREEMGYYWGYTVRRCDSLSTVFTECPFDGGYDVSFGTSERGSPLSKILDNPIPRYNHFLLVFGGVSGLEAAVAADSELQENGVKPNEAEKLFDYWVNVLPGQGSRTIRTEEAVWLGLMGLKGVVERNSTV